MDIHLLYSLLFIYLFICRKKKKKRKEREKGGEREREKTFINMDPWENEWKERNKKWSTSQKERDWLTGFEWMNRIDESSGDEDCVRTSHFRHNRNDYWYVILFILLLLLLLLLRMMIESIQFGITIAGALSQLAFIRRLELEEPFTTTTTSRSLLPRGYNNDDKEAQILRLGYVKPEVLSWSPRIILLHNFLSYEECDYLRGVALPRLKISTVVDANTGKGIKSDVRTSSGMFLNHEERKYPMIHAIEKRISVYSQIPIENGELMQVLRYEKNQYYRPHHDYFSDTVSHFTSLSLSLYFHSLLYKILQSPQLQCNPFCLLNSSIWSVVASE
jgi:prolyl 4-hydroxylase